ncbi:MAG: Flp pilus assembly protein CpaB, partial [bacterium]
MASRESALLYETEPLPTLVAKKDILENVRIDETMVEVVEVPRRWQQAKALSSIDEIRDQITAVPLLAGQQIAATRLVTPDEGGLALYLTSGLRAISLDVTVYNAVGGHVRPGNRVDILGTFDFGTGEKSDVRTVTLLQDVWVLSVVDDIGRPTTRDIRPNAEEGGPPPEPEPAPSEAL